jgi:hypothetical protein
VKIAKKNGELIGSFVVTQRTTFGDLVAIAGRHIPSSVLAGEKTIGLYSGPDRANSAEFPYAAAVLDCITEGTTIFLHIEPKLEAEGF